MMIEGHREIAADEDGCFIQVHQGAFATGTFVVVDLTAGEWAEKRSKQVAADNAKGTAYLAELGKQWVLHYANGSSETFTAKDAGAGELPDFQSQSGAIVKIATTKDNKVMVVSGGCMRSGTLVGNEVKDGTSMGECKPAGAWTGQKK